MCLIEIGEPDRPRLAQLAVLLSGGHDIAKSKQTACFAKAGADFVVDGPGFFVERWRASGYSASWQVHVAQALDAVGFAEPRADRVVDGPGFFVARAGLRVLRKMQVHIPQAPDAVGFA